MPLKNLSQIFIWPSIMALLTLLGLTLALLEDGVFEKIALLGLALPVVVILYFYSKSFYIGKPKRDRQ
jgi:di/tricarboxylate transporter